MFTRLCLVLLFVVSVTGSISAVAAADTQTVYRSPHSLTATAERFKAAAEAHGLVVTTMMMNAQKADSYGLDMPASIVISFGLPKQEKSPQSDDGAANAELDQILPRAIVFTNEDGTVSLAVNTNDASFDGKGAHGHVASGYAEIIESFAAKATAP